MITFLCNAQYYTTELDTALLQKIERWTGGKPMMLSEFDYTSSKDSGLPGGSKRLDNQEQRGLAYRAYLEQGAALGFVVGVEWFTLVDQPASGTWWGRYDGECANTGLFSVVDRPWKLAVEQMAKTNHTIYDILLGNQPPFTWDQSHSRTDGAGK